jgi:hypothetical protein
MPSELDLPQGALPQLEIRAAGKTAAEPVEPVRLKMLEQQASRHVPYTPLVAEGLSFREAKAVQNSTSFASDRRRIEGPDSPRPERRERDADEIQIHIGRIEVTAVPPAPPRPAAPPTRRSLRLEEYLRRNRERAQ